MEPTINLLRQILRAGQNFIGTRKEMAAFIFENEHLFKSSDFENGDWVRYKVQGITLFGRFSYLAMAGLNKGLAVIVREGRVEYVKPTELTKC